MKKRSAFLCFVSSIVLSAALLECAAQQDEARATPLKLSSWFGDHMVLPCDRAVPIRGTAAPKVEVTVSFAAQKKRAVSDEHGKWEAVLDPMPVSDQSRPLTVSSPGTSKRFDHILVGDIWLCSGQSNMGMTVGRTDEKQAAVKVIRTVAVRYFNGSSWVKATPQNVSKLSAVGVWFAMEMARRRDRPIGLFVAVRGGTGIEGWIPRNAFPDTERGRAMSPLVDDPEVRKAAKEDAADFRPYGQHRLAKWGLARAVPAAEFEKRLRPFADLPIRGVVWYQGESNAMSIAAAREYRFWLRSLVASWRQFFGSSKMPFIVIQLPEYDPGTDAGRSGWAEMQKVQAEVAQELDGVRAVDTKGLGDLKDIHPRRKQEVGRRAAEAACRPVDVVRVDIHERLYPDRWPGPAEPRVISVPRGAPATFQFAVRAEAAGTAGLSVTGDIAGKPRLHWLQAVHVEGNTQGSLKNRPGGEVPAGWMDHLVRAAPFDTLEVLVEGDRTPIVAGRTHGVVVEVSVPKDAKPGTYEGKLRIQHGNDEAAAAFSYRVYETVLPDPLPLHSIHWLWPEPVNLTNGEVPEWWSERHWELLEAAGKQLRRFGDDTVYTPLVNYRKPLIQITRRKDGTFAFDYSRFDRWGELFLGLGFRYLSGHHIVNMGAKTFVNDEATGKKEPLLVNPKDQDAWLAFLPAFYDSFHAHLKKKGWLGNYLQCQYDEPRDVELYKRLAALARKHLPGIPTIDAINSSRQDVFSPLVDIQVFNLIGLNRYQQIAAQRNAAGKGVWLYHCTSPYPPHPNRHIDSPLTDSRLYPWLCYKLGANGFLFWAANMYRGADEYRTSIGPFPNGSQDPGHPPGDNWFYYRSPDGLRPSIRIVSFREGLIDHALLTMLAERDREAAATLVAKIAPSITRFERDPTKFHQARTALLEALERP